jgi:hypothetical protein
LISLTVSEEKLKSLEVWWKNLSQKGSLGATSVNAVKGVELASKKKGVGIKGSCSNDFAYCSFNFVIALLNE